MQPHHRLLAILFLLAGTGHATSSLAADPEPIRRAIDGFLVRQASSLPGPARHEIGTINASGIPPGCQRIDVSFPAGSRAWGRLHVQVRCGAGADWSLFVPVRVRVTADYVVSARALRPGEVLAGNDLRTQRGDLSELPANVVTDPAEAIGQAMGIALPSGRPLRADILKKPMVIRQGQNTRVISGGGGFEVSAEGKAIGSAVAGQLVRVRMVSGRIVNGVAQADGTVRVAQ